MLAPVFYFIGIKNAAGQQQYNINLGVNLQLYPAGIITSIHAEKFMNPHNAMILRLGGNFANRKNFSAYNDNEKGNGLGATVGYRHYFDLKTGRLLIGGNTDIWNMWIHWRNKVGQDKETHGTTYTLVLQPWLEAGYVYPLSHSPLQVGLTTGFGREINIVTSGKAVGQGWMNSVLLYVIYSIK